MHSFLTILGLCSITLLLLWGLERRRGQQRRHHRQRGLQTVRQVLTLLTAMQQHRGMASALLSGDARFAGKLAGKQSEVSAALTGVAQDLPSATHSGTGRRLARLAAEWEQLCRDFRQGGADASFARHTALIRDALHLMGDVGERAGLLEDPDTVVRREAEMLLTRIPLLIESIGQTRALGTGFAAQGQCGAVGRIRLRFLKARVDDGLAHVAAMAADEARACCGRVKNLQQTLDQQLITAQRIEIAPEKLFALASEAIDACLLLWQATLAKMPGTPDTRGTPFPTRGRAS